MTNDTLSFNITGVILWHSDLPGTVITFVMWTALLSLGFALCLQPVYPKTEGGLSCYFRKSTVWIPCAMTVLGLFVLGIWRILMNPIYDNAPVNWAAIVALGILGPVLASCCCLVYLGETPYMKAEAEKIAQARGAPARTAAARGRAERIAEEKAHNAEIRAKRNGKTKRPKMSMPDVDDFDC